MNKLVLKALSFLAVFIIFMPLTQAEKQEWYDNAFDFTKARKIAVLIRPSEHMNVLQGNETADIFMEKMYENLISELPVGQYEFASGRTIAQRIYQESGVDIASIADSDLQKADMIAYEYIQKHFDLFVVWSPIVYDTGTQYCEGYVYTTPATNTSTVWLPNGQTATIITNGQAVHNVPGGNYPAVYVAVRVDVIDLQSGSPVWMRIDDRAKVNRTVFDNTKPKDMYKRILGSFIEDFRKNLQERTGKEIKANF